MTSRIKKLRDQFEQLTIDAFLITFLPHLRYLSGFSGTSGIGLITHDAAYLITDGRYTTQARQQIQRGEQKWKIFIVQDSLFDAFDQKRLLRKGWRIGFDGNTLPYSTYQSLGRKFPAVRFVSKGWTIEKIAAVKDASEIKKIKHAVAITDCVFKEVLEILRPGIMELDIAAEISYRQRKHGAEADAFEAIVASGERGALPHGRASSKKIRRGELVTLDFGCVYEGYHSDLTRTVAVGKPMRESKKIYQIVLDAQSRAIEKAASGMLAKDLDAVARSYIKKMGYERYFNHSLGHGIGLQIHEPPRISSMSKARLQTGNVITIEPGIYIPKFGGVRIEDDVLITNGQCEVLNRSPKKLLIF